MLSGSAPVIIILSNAHCNLFSPSCSWNIAHLSLNSLWLNFFHLLARKPNLEKCSIYSSKIFHNFHLSESSFTCPGLRASVSVRRLSYSWKIAYLALNNNHRLTTLLVGDFNTKLCKLGLKIFIQHYTVQATTLTNTKLCKFGLKIFIQHYTKLQHWLTQNYVSLASDLYSLNTNVYVETDFYA